MTSSANKKALAINEQQQAAIDARKAVVETLNDVQATLRLLKIRLGISPAQIAIANIGKGSRGHSALETKRIEAGQLMTKMGYRIDYSNEKSGLVRIVGPNFSADFYDIADFDGTASRAVRRCDARAAVDGRGDPCRIHELAEVAGHLGGLPRSHPRADGGRGQRHQRSGLRMDAVDWRAHLIEELDRLGVQVEKLPSGVTRLTNEHGHLMTTDIRNLTTSDLKTFAGRNGWRQ